MRKILFGFVLVFATLFTNAMAEDSPKAVIVFDASGSMWGQIKGKSKIEIARDALKNVVNEWNPKVELGLTVYGHRRKGDCNDIESVIPVGKVDKDKIIKRVMGIQPKGKTPISRSLRKVADELKYTEEKATIILISDGKETCDSDPCSVAKELEKKGIDFVTHVIGFNVDKSTDKQLECIAKATGGEYFSAKNASALNDAMKSIVKKVEKVEPPKPKAKKLENNLEVTASETEGGKGIEASCRAYKVIDGEVDNSDSWYIDTKKKKVAKKHLPVGKYTLKCSYNAFKREIPIEIRDDNVTKVHVVFAQTGKVYITAREKEGGKLVYSDCRIYNEDKSDSWHLSSRRKNPESNTLQLPIGKYSANCSYNEFKKKDIPLEIKAGETSHIDVIFGQTGKIYITAREKDGGKLVYSDCRIYNEDKSDSWHLSSRRKNPDSNTLQLPIGKYSANCSYNEFKKKDIPVEIKAGKTTHIDVVFAPFHISVKGITPCTNLHFELITTSGETVVEKDAQAYKGIDFVVSKGKYVIEISNEDKKVKKSIDVGAGENSAIVDFGGDDTLNSIEGVWKTSEGKATIGLDGKKVHGYYDSDNGELIGEMTYPKRFEGYWIEDGSNEKCSTAKNGRYYWGKVIWKFDDKMCSFKGKYSYCNKKPNSSWRGSYIRPLNDNDKHNLLMKNDTKNKSKEEIKKEVISTEKAIQSKPSLKNIEIKGIDPKDLEEAGKMLNALGSLFGGKTEQSKDAKAEKEKADKEFDQMSQELDMFTK